MNKNKILQIFYIYLLFQPILDVITSLMVKYLSISITLGIIIRGIVFLIAGVYILFISKSKYQKDSIIYLLILFLFSVIYFITKKSIFSSFSLLFEEILYMFKYYYILILILFLINFFDEFKPNNRKVFRILQINLFLYCFLIIISNITGTAFGTYVGGVGNTGWFYSGNEISVIVALLFPLLYLLINKSNSYLCLLYIIPIILGIEIIGTKTSMLGLLLPTIIFLFYYLIRIKHGKLKQFFVTLIILLIILISSNQLPVIKNINDSISRYNYRIENPTETGSKYSKDVTTTVLLSDRDYFEENIKVIFNNSSTISKLFGIGFTNREEINNENITKLIEMDFYEIFYRYGIIGFIIYFMPFIIISFYVLNSCIRLHFNLNIKQLVLGYISYIGLAIAFLVGHTLGSPSVTIYLSLSFVLLLYYMKNKQYKIITNNKKITILALHLGIGGIEKYIYSLSKMLIDDYEIEIISTYKVKENNKLKFDDKIKIRYLINDYPHKKELKESFNSFNIFKIIKYSLSSIKLITLKYCKNIDAIENIDSKYVISTRIFHNKLVGNYKNRDIIAIATEHNYHNNNITYINKLIDSCNNIDYLVLVSKNLKEFYEGKLINTKCIYIPNVLDEIPQYCKKKKISNKLISVGRLVDEKGFFDLIDIINILKDKIPDIVLDIYGDGPLKEKLQTKINELKLQKNIRLLGFIENKEILGKMCNYDLYVMTSFTESFGLVLIEAMSRSIPCIAFDSANGAKIILKNNQGILILNRNNEDYANSIIDLLSNIDKLNEISRNGYNSILKYDINIVKKKWINLIKNK